MAIIPWLEKTVHGDKNFINDIKNLGRFGQGQYAAGDDLSGEALQGFADLDRSYSDRLRSGNVLDPNVSRQIDRSYSMLRGGIRDRGAGERVASRASVAQQVAQSGGRLSPEQRAALLAQADESIGQQEFESLSGAGVQQARDIGGATITAVNDLNDRIERARGVRLQAGQFKMQAGQQAYIQSILSRLDRNKAIASTISSFFGGGFGGGSGGGGSV